MKITLLNKEYSVCGLSAQPDMGSLGDFVFYAKTDDEISLVCEREKVPPCCVRAEHGWRAFKIGGILDFSMVGIIANITALLAENKISVFVVSTYNTDYFLIKSEKHVLAARVLKNAGYEVDNI